MNLQLHYKTLSVSTSAEYIYNALFSKDGPSFWLDSSRIDKGYSRFSFMGSAGGPRKNVISYNLHTGGIRFNKNEHETFEVNIFEYLKQSIYAAPEISSPDLPFDFIGGYVGYFGYELMEITEGVKGKQSKYPDAFFIYVDRFIAIDHETQCLYLVFIDNTIGTSAQEWFKEITLHLEQLPAADSSPSPSSKRLPEISKYLEVQKGDYLQAIEECKSKIADGESYEVCLTNRVRIEYHDTIPDPLTLYRTLRVLNPAPYACFLNCGDFFVLSSSPECFLKINKAGVIETRPIKGTMPRNTDPEKDNANIEKLRTDEKFFSENLMIVDLLRNDLTKVCYPGSVEVSNLMHVESYATLHQLVSTIQGQCREHSVDCIKACFPGGSMTGAPKKRTLEIIEALEKSARGIYAGSIGYLSLNGCIDLNIVIRTIVMDDCGAEIGVGGAITHLSDPDEEFEEILLKAFAPFRAVQSYT